MPITITELISMSQVELDDLYRQGSVGDLPNGHGWGTVIVRPGSRLNKTFAPLIRSLTWKGKVFYGDQGFMLNNILPFGLFGIYLVKAQVYQGTSWIDSGDTIVLDYSKTSFIAQNMRDEIREVSPGIYLGQAYWKNRRVLNFILQF